MDPADIESLKPSRRNLARARSLMTVVNDEMLERFAPQLLTMDANDLTAVFARELEWIDAALEREQFAPLKSEQLIPYHPSGGPGVALVTYRKVTELGQAEFVGNGTTQLPRVDVVGDEYSRKVENLGVAWAVTVFELLAVAANPTIHIDTERKTAAVNAIRRKHDRTAFEGNALLGWTGLINDPNVPLVTPITGDWGGAATPLQMVADMNKLSWSIFVATKELYEPDTLLVPTSLGQRLDQPLGENADKTVRRFVLENSAHIKRIETTHYLETASATNGARVIAYKKSPDVLRYGANELFAEEPQQAKGLELETPCHGRTSGTQIRRPLALAYMDVD
jgi:hypothetical protein